VRFSFSGTRLAAVAVTAAVIGCLAGPQSAAVGASTDDAFAHATPLGTPTVYETASGSEFELFYTTFVDNVGATAEPGEPSHGGAAASPAHSVWLTWTAPYDATVQFRGVVSGTNDDCFAPTYLGVYTGGSVDALTRVASATSGPCVMADTRVEARAGTTYRIALDSTGESALSYLYTEVWPHCTITGTSSADTIVGTTRNDVICGLGGNDAIEGGGGADAIAAGPGVDAVSFADSPLPVTALLNQGTATGQGRDYLWNAENVIGSPHGDRLNGDAGTNVLNGGAGADELFGLDGADTLFGGPGSDTVGGGRGHDLLSGGSGVDTAHFARATAVDVDLARGTSTGMGSDTLKSVENVLGSPGADHLTGSSAANWLRGRSGDDSLAGRAGDDVLTGAMGSDALNGGTGRDRCDGGSGIDRGAGCETTVAVP